VCDDAFDDNDAKVLGVHSIQLHFNHIKYIFLQVLCSMMGFKLGGRGLNKTTQVGIGPIWLDELQCTGACLITYSKNNEINNIPYCIVPRICHPLFIGEENSVAECIHEPWGEGNCQHAEDVSIECFEDAMLTASGEEDNLADEASVVTPPTNSRLLPKILPQTCGIRSSDEVPTSVQPSRRGKVIAGANASPGAHPWQVPIYVENTCSSFAKYNLILISTGQLESESRH
jgi:hypothetical protein